MASIMARVCSATATALAPGVFITAMPFARGCVEVDVVDADAGASNHAQLLGMFQQRGVRLHRGAHDQGIGRFEVFGELAVELISGEDGPAGLLQLLDGGGGNLFCNDDFQGKIDPFELRRLP